MQSRDSSLRAKYRVRRSHRALWLDVSRIAIRLKQPQHAIYVREVRTVLLQLAFRLFDQPGDKRSLLTKGRNDV
jgi:hypothetical protein